MKKILLIALVAFSFSIGNGYHCYCPPHPGCSRTIILPDGQVATEVPGSCGTRYIIMPNGQVITIVE